MNTKATVVEQSDGAPPSVIVTQSPGTPISLQIAQLAVLVAIIACTTYLVAIGKLAAPIEVGLLGTIVGGHLGIAISNSNK